jgi:hypothetical protein
MATKVETCSRAGVDVFSARGSDSQNKPTAEARKAEVEVGSDRDRISAQRLPAEKFRIPHATLKGFEDLLGLGVRASEVDHRGAPCEVAGMRKRGWPTGKQRATLVSGAEESGERRENLVEP